MLFCGSACFMIQFCCLTQHSINGAAVLPDKLNHFGWFQQLFIWIAIDCTLSMNSPHLRILIEHQRPLPIPLLVFKNKVMLVFLFIVNSNRKKPLYARQYARIVEDKNRLSSGCTHEKSLFCQNGHVFGRWLQPEYDAFHRVQGV